MMSVAIISPSFHQYTRLCVKKISDIIYLALVNALGVIFMSLQDDGGGGLPKIFDQYPDLKKRLEDYLGQVPEEQRSADLEKFKKFVSGEMTWAEIRGIPRSTLKILAEIAYNEFVKGNYRLSESLFKGLSIIDHSNWYYRAALGAIYQKQKLYEDAIAEYSMALTINDQEITSLANRGECYMRLENYPRALDDFSRAVELDPEGKNNWARRARAYRQKLIQEGHVTNPSREEA